MIKFNKIKTFKIILMVMITIINIVLVIDVFTRYNNRSYLIMLSILFELVLIFIFRYKCDLKNFSIIIMIIIGFFRYSLIPFYLIINQSSFMKRSNMILDDSRNYMVLVLLIVEMISIVLSVIIFSKNNIIYRTNNLRKIGSSKVYVASFIIFIIIISFSPQIRSYYSFFLIGNTDDIDSMINGGVFYILNFILMIGKTGILFILLNKYSNTRHEIKNKSIKILYCVIIAIITSSIYRGGNRGYLLMNYLSTILVLICVFRDNIKIIIYPMIISLLVILGSITAYRTFGYNNVDSTYTQTVDKEFISDYSQMYLAGPDNILIAIKSRENLDLIKGSKMLVSDMMFTVPILGKPFREISTVSLFNNKFYNHSEFQDQIVPLVGEGYITLGILGAFILPFIVFSLAIKFYYKFMSSNTFEEKYLYAFLSIWFALGSIYNMNILIQTIVHHSLPLIIIIIIRNRTYNCST